MANKKNAQAGTSTANKTDHTAIEQNTPADRDRDNTHDEMEQLEDTSDTTTTTRSQDVPRPPIFDLPRS